MLRRILFLVIAALFLGGLFVFLKPQQQTKPTTQTKETTITPTIITTQTNENIFELVVQNGQLTSGPKVITVSQGATITIKITSDQQEELHIHGYDKRLTLEANTPAEITFVADMSGRFPYELEHSQTEIGALEVQPK